jgi:hypothetical protein
VDVVINAVSAKRCQPTPARAYEQRGSSTDGAPPQPTTHGRVGVKEMELLAAESELAFAGIAKSAREGYQLDGSSVITASINGA